MCIMEIKEVVYMSFVFTRIDDRAIHGQTVTAWSKVFQNNGILLVDDAIAHDPIMKNIYKNAGVGIKVYVYSNEEAYIKAAQAAESAKPYLLIVRSPLTLVNLIKNGVNIGENINIGNLPLNDSRRPIHGFIAMNDQEIEACNYLDSLNLNVYFQDIPANKAFTWKQIMAK